MANMNLKKDFANGEKLPAKDLNNNFLVIEECINNSTKGVTAYEVAKQEGFEGTEEEWLNSLVGPQGPEGDQGPQGNPAITGGYAVLQTDSLREIVGNDNAFSNYQVILSNLEIEPLQKDDLHYLNIDTSSLNLLEVTCKINCDLLYPNNTPKTCDVIVYTIDVYDGDMLNVLNTYRYEQEVTNIYKYNADSTNALTATNDVAIPKFMIDTSSLESVNLVMSVNLLKYEEGVASEGSVLDITGPTGPYFLIEAFI